jgi:hypothetical protein
MKLRKRKALPKKRSAIVPTLLAMAIGVGLACVYVAMGIARINRPHMTIYADAACVCCKRWATDLARGGFHVRVRGADDLASVRARLGVPEDLASCSSTAQINGYVLEGQIPVADLRRLVAERPDIGGLALRSTTERPSGASSAQHVETVAFRGVRRTVFALHAVESGAECPQRGSRCDDAKAAGE